MLTSVARKAGGIVILTMALLAGKVAAQPVSPFPCVERFYVGTYSGGIWEASLNLATGKFIATNLAVYQGGAPSFIAITPNRKFLYAIDEDNNLALAYSINPTNGLLTKTTSMSSGGQQPPFVVADKSGSNVFVANYGDGWVTGFPINQTNGTLGAATAHYEVDVAHCVAIDCAEHYLFVCDLGIDRVWSFKFDPSAGTITTNNPGYVSVTPGSGPRHMAFDPQCKRAYLICQNSFTVVAFDYDSTKGVLTSIQTISTLTNGMSAGVGAAEIAVHPSGRFLYGSNRGTSPDTIVVYAINSTNGTLTQVQQAVTGSTPRNFAIDPTGAYCIVADENSNDIRLYSINAQTGLLTYLNQKITSISGPVCIVPFILQPPQPVLSVLPGQSNVFSFNFSNTLSLLTYQLYESPALPSPGQAWNLISTGGRGQTNFTWTNSLPQEFFRVGVLTNY